MKGLRFHLYFIFGLAILMSCNSQDSTKPTTDIFDHSSSYKPPVFVNDERVDKILKNASEIQTLIEEHAQEKNIPGIAYGIVVDHELVLASATGFSHIENESRATTESSFRIASMTKSFTAMAILKLRDEGKLSLSDPVSMYIPEMSALEYLTADAPIIDIENLLTMTAGFPEDNPWGDRQLNEPNQMLIDLISEGVSFSNATSYGFEYSNTGYAILGSIISHVTAIPYQEYINRNILQPLGMEHTYWEYDSVPQEQLVIGYRWEDEQWKLEPMLHDGSYGAMGGLITSIEDFSKYVSFHLSAWPPRSDEDTGPVKRSTLREMQTPQFSRLYVGATDYSGNPCPVISGYGYGLGIAHFCNDLVRVSHGGALPGFGSNYHFFPKYGVGIMAFCNLTYTSAAPFSKIGEILFEIEELKPRQLPVSDILNERKKQVTQLIQNWNAELETEILAENFYMDKSREDRIEEVQEVLKKAGKIENIEKMIPINQLRGNFKIGTEYGFIYVYFTLTPEKLPMVQSLRVTFQPNEAEK